MKKKNIEKKLIPQWLHAVIRCALLFISVAILSCNLSLGQDLIFSHSKHFSPEFRISPFEPINQSSSQRLKYSAYFIDEFNSPSNGFVQWTDSFYFQNGTNSYLISPSLTNIYGIQNKFATDTWRFPGDPSLYSLVSYLNAYKFPDSTFYIIYDSLTNQMDTLNFWSYDYDSITKTVHEYQRVWYNSQQNSVLRTTMVYNGIHLSYLYNITFDTTSLIYDTSFVYYFKHDSINRLIEDLRYVQGGVDSLRYLIHYSGNLVDSVECILTPPIFPIERFYYTFDWNYPYFKRTNYHVNPPLIPGLPNLVYADDTYLGKVNTNGFIDSITTYFWSTPNIKQYTDVFKYDINNYLTDCYRIKFDTNGVAYTFSDSVIYRYTYVYPQSTLDPVQNKDLLTIYPNPCSQMLFIQYSSDSPEKREYQINSMGGHLIESRTVQSHRGNNVDVINMAHYPNGIYFLRYGSNTYKFIKQN